MLDYQRTALDEVVHGLAEAERAMNDERWEDALVALTPVWWAVRALQDKMPRPSGMVVATGSDSGLV